jgi:hypothetical protein
MYGVFLSRSLARMHSLNAQTMATQFVEERVNSAARARRFARVRRRFARGERRGSPSSSPVPPGRLSTSGAGR